MDINHEGGLVDEVGRVGGMSAEMTLNSVWAVSYQPVDDRTIALGEHLRMFRMYWN